MNLFRLRGLSCTRRGWQVRTLAAFPTGGDALDYGRFLGTTGRWWIDHRRAPALSDATLYTLTRRHARVNQGWR